MAKAAQIHLMAQAKLLLQPHVRPRPARAHEGQVIALKSNQLWSSGGLEISWATEIAGTRRDR